MVMNINDYNVYVYNDYNVINHKGISKKKEMFVF